MDAEKKTWFYGHVAQLHRAAESPDVEAGMKYYSGLVKEYLFIFPDSVFNEDYAQFLKEI